MLRKCKDCRLEAHTEEALKLFVTDPTCKHNRANLCLKCKRLRGNSGATKARRRAAYAANNTPEQREKLNEIARRNEKKRKEKMGAKGYYEYKKNIQLKHKYNITLEEMRELQETQGNKCKICGTPFDANTAPCVDHNHDTGEIRGLLCDACNTGIGLLQDSTSNLRAAIEYLETNGSYSGSINHNKS